MGKGKKYAAIFSCLVLVVALGAGIAGSRSAKKESEKIKTQNEAALLQAENDVKMVDVNKNANPNGINYDSEKNGTVKDYYDNKAKDTESSESSEKSVPSKEIKSDTDDNKDNSSEKQNTVSEVDMDAEEFVLADTPDAKPVFSWPIDGDIVMDFSADSLVYDATLDQYRTNNVISISSPKGTAVAAAAPGTIEEVTYDDERGHVVTIFHGNGWRTTYGQLDENVAVNQGDIVEAGEILGTVASPTKYSVALGEHLDFAVIEDDTAIDPKIALAN